MSKKDKDIKPSGPTLPQQLSHVLVAILAVFILLTLIQGVETHRTVTIPNKSSTGY